MSKHTEDLKAKWQDAEAQAQKLMADKDEALAKIRTRFTSKLQKANDQAAEAQKRYLDAEAANALLDQPDGAALAQQRIDDGGLSAEAVKAVGFELPS